MSAEIEQRLRGALEASAELITEPPGSADYQPPATSLDRPAPRQRGQRPWLAPLLAAAAIVVVAAGATAVVRTVDTHENTPVAHRPSLPVTSSLSPTPALTRAVGEQRLVGPQVIDAELFPAGRGYARTPHSLLWTEDLGASWRDVTPPGLTHEQLQSAGVAVLPDGHEWVATTPKTGSSAVTVQRRSSTTGTWTSTSVPLGPLTLARDVAATTMTYVSFTDANNGWLLVGEQITHTGIGELLRTTDGGARWAIQASQHNLPAVGTIHFLTPQVGYLDSVITGAWWTTRDAGRSWTQLKLPAPAAKKADSISIITAPTLAADAIVVATNFTTPGQGNDDGIGVYRSTDEGATWTVHQVASQSPTEQYDFAATPDATSYVLLRSRSATDGQRFTWVASHSTDGSQTFTNSTSAHRFYPGPLTLADADNLWTIGGSDGCKNVKSDCWHTTGLIASADGGATWHQMKLPS